MEEEKIRLECVRISAKLYAEKSNFWNPKDIIKYADRLANYVKNGLSETVE